MRDSEALTGKSGAKSRRVSVSSTPRSGSSQVTLATFFGVQAARKVSVSRDGAAGKDTVVSDHAGWVSAMEPFEAGSAPAQAVAWKGVYARGM